MSARFEISTAVDGSYFFRLRAENGHIVLSSEMYRAKGSAEKAVDSVRANCTIEERYERRADTGGRPYFVLKAANGQVIGQSQMYRSPADMANGIASTKANGPNAKLVDLAAA